MSQNETAMREAFENQCREQNRIYTTRSEPKRVIDLAMRQDDGISITEYHNFETQRLWRFWMDCTEVALSTLPTMTEAELQKLVYDSDGIYMRDEANAIASKIIARLPHIVRPS